MRALPLALVLVALALPAATAQLPSTAVCGPLVLSEPATPQPIAPGDTAVVVVGVRNDGNLPVRVEVSAAPPAGWQVQSSPPAESLDRGASRDFSFTFLASPSASDDAVIPFSATGTCDSVPGALCQGACTTSANTQVQVPLRANEGFTLPLLQDLNFPVEYLIASVVLVGLAVAIPLAMRRKKGGVVADCPEPLKMVRAGRGTSFPLSLIHI